MVWSCSSIKGIAAAVVDANVIIQGGGRLFHSADRFVSITEVISEIRDPASHHALHFLPFTVDTLEPSPVALKKVVSFVRATGDLQTLSDVDMKLITLTYTLESQIHGTQHLRDSPPITINVKRLPEKDLPDWGSNTKLVLRMLPVKMAGRALETGGNGFEKPKRCLTKKREIKVDEKKMVASGIDASLGQSDENADDW
ncbi:hypothetical protein C2S52_018609 [Perilla frutescens var. hirtella]|nr:hypothetical protein C2S52_018609 [Perilla frutescens var. hirtella]